MKLKFIKKYISIEKLSTPDDPLPDFIVLTGLNGSGKTHLLQAIHEGAVQVFDDLEDPKTARYFDFKTLEPKDEVGKIPLLEDEKGHFWNQLNSRSKEWRKKIIAELSPYFKNELYESDLNIIFSCEKEEDLSTLEFGIEDISKTYSTVKNLLHQSSTTIKKVVTDSLPLKEKASPNNTPEGLAKYIHDRGLTVEEIISRIENNSVTPLFLIKENEFYENYPSEIQTDPFQRSLSDWFLRYSQEMKINTLKREDKEEIGLDSHYLTREQFIKRHGEAPWDFVDHLFKIAEMPFTITKPSLTTKGSFKAELYDHENNMISFASLSSGEKIIMSLAIALSYASANDSLTSLPSLLLLDEIDAPMHPSMTKFLLDVVNDVIVKEKGVSVILATHSPSTVALSPEESIYHLRKNGSHKFLEKKTKDSALALLTTGVPTLSISYKNQRQVFVESGYDAEFYDKLYQEILLFGLNKNTDNKNNNENISLSFIPSAGSHNGDCNVVRDQVKNLRMNGVDSVYGIIDWDKQNSDNEHVFVLGYEKGYSIETFILDPILVGTLLIREKKFDINKFTLPEKLKSYNKIPDLNEIEMQNFVDSVLDYLKPKENVSSGTISRTYLGDFTINLPIWFCYYNGHALEKSYKSVFPPLNAYRSEPELKMEILNKVVNDHPKLLPIEFRDLFIKLRQ